MFPASWPPRPSAALEHKTSAVTATATKHADGHGATITCQVSDCLEATITLNVTMENMRAVQQLPNTFVMGNGTRSWDLVRIDPHKHWSYKFEHRWRAGGTSGQQDPRIAYRLPYEPGTVHRVIQGNFGTHSHGPGSGDEYATDFQMPVGTLVCAAPRGKSSP